MSAPRLSSRQKIILIAILAGFAGFLLLHSVRLNFKNFGDLFNLLGIILAAVGAFLALWQVILAINASADAKENNIQNALEAIRQASDKRDRYHEQQLSDLRARLEAIATQLEQHQFSLGHKGSLEQILQIKDQVSDLRAALAMSTRQGEVFLKLDRIEKDIEILKKNS